MGTQGVFRIGVTCSIQFNRHLLSIRQESIIAPDIGIQRQLRYRLCLSNYLFEGPMGQRPFWLKKEQPCWRKTSCPGVCHRLQGTSHGREVAGDALYLQGDMEAEGKHTSVWLIE